jgi:hypothetical protein
MVKRRVREKLLEEEGATREQGEEKGGKRKLRRKERETRNCSSTGVGREKTPNEG